MDRQDKQQLVQQYVERQKAYVPAYTKEDLWSGCQRTPSKSLRGNEFGFDTPVLRPRAPVSGNPQTKHAQKAGASKLPGREAEPKEGPTPGRSGPQDPSLRKKGEPRLKRKKAPTPTDTDDGRVARLADRRERKKKKRAIVNPLQKHDEDSPSDAGPKKGRKQDQNTKKPAALALLYGFSATNVTKNRLTLKPAPSLGVFNKGKASVKKKVTATKKALSKNDMFSESVFLNKRSEQIADHLDVDDDSSVASISNDPTLEATRVTSRTTKDRDKGTKITACTTGESEVWDIELQSKLPSSACDVSSGPRVNDSAPVVLDLRGAEWPASLQEHEARCNKALARSLSDAQGSQPARSDLRDELVIPHAVDEVPSVHPSHSASQIGRYNTGTRPSGSYRVASRYFTGPLPVSVPQSSAGSLNKPRSNDSLGVLDFQNPDQDVRCPATDVQTILRGTSPINSSTGLAQPMVDFRTRSDIVQLEFSSDDFPVPNRDVQDATIDGQTVYRVASPISISQLSAELQTRCGMTPLEFLGDRSRYDYYAPANVSLEPLLDYGHLEASVTDSQGAEYHQRNGWDSYWPQWCSLGGLVEDDVQDDFVQRYAPECDDSASVEPAECDPEEVQLCDPQDEGEDGSMCWDRESAKGMAEFLEGRALLLGVPEWPQRVGLSGLAQAEMDVVSRLRDHWRPQRLA